MTRFEELDPLIHAPIRLAILTILISVKEADFTYLKEAANTSDGNLSTHLTKLEEAGYIQIEKKFVAKKPKTTCMIATKGREAYLKYIESLKSYLGSNN
ncbi:MAG: winged helix-turn-helix domain-containing protein [Fidelibacterota bacterium]